MARQRRKHLAGLVQRLTDEELDGFLFGLRALHRARVDEVGDPLESMTDDEHEDDEAAT